MSELTDKARAATTAAKELLETAEPTNDAGVLCQADLENYSRLMNAASVNAHIAQAEALEALVFLLKK